MNHRTKSVVRDVVEGHKNRPRYFFSQPVNGVKFLLERRTCASQNMTAAEKKRADG